MATTVTAVRGISSYSNVALEEAGLVPFAETEKGATLKEFYKEVLLDTTGGAGTVSTTGSTLPAGAFYIRVVARVTTVIVGPTTNWDLGVVSPADPDRWATNKLLALGTTVTAADWNADALYAAPLAAATEFILTADAGTFTSGAVRIGFWFCLVTAPTS